ncbi:peptidoglycan editing factor PgeF [Pseudoxanthomonas indica]|uniref:Purine nucleoside phosphorylase n=1 Tax=Pseudoxanthomonas indica TaxID=428993 RepID=A0A1T5LGM0_9GAMM|nr:peptidoglycan editing factor PgeF [Pseudoxanthomonas indica]GGD35012.1 laccase domain protein [Pseudoxanthomonas indica]SKC75197.1 conserved hypothetical protein [Pseudoxanthomonas indica]
MSEGAILRADWPAPAGVHAFTTLRHGAGRSQPPFDHFNLGTRYGDYRDDPAVVEANRIELIERFGLPAAPQWLRQVHGTDVAVVERVDGEEPVADAAVTRQAGVALAILTADCLPVVFASDDGQVIGAAHAGWRGLVGGVLENTIAAMAVPGSSIIAWLGPAAGPASYEIGAEVHDAFVGHDAGAASAFIATRPAHWRVDLYALARRRLHAAGVTRVSGGGRDTIAEADQFFSHRRDAQTGRMATIIWKVA